MISQRSGVRTKTQEQNGSEECDVGERIEKQASRNEYEWERKKVASRWLLSLSRSAE